MRTYVHEDRWEPDQVERVSSGFTKSQLVPILYLADGYSYEGFGLMLLDSTNDLIWLPDTTMSFCSDIWLSPAQKDLRKWRSVIS